MAHQKRKHSNGRTGKRRAHDALSLKSLAVCSNCNARVMPHRICPECGHYKGRQVVVIASKEEKK